MWRPGTSRTEFDGELLIWTDDARFTMPRLAGAVMIHLDGAVTLSQLADDAAAAFEIPTGPARVLVATAAAELGAYGAVDGLVLPPEGLQPVRSPLEADEALILGESTRVDPDTGAELRVVTDVDASGNIFTLEHLPDGRRRITTELVVGTGTAEQELLALALEGNRSMAELVPVDSCLGSKLRNLDHVPLISFTCVDGQVRSVRCHDTVVAEGIGELVGSDRASTERGPIEAFVVTPLEGDGPLRIYDGGGQRRGRPRDPAESVAVVDQVLGEVMTAADGQRGDGPIPVDLVLVTGPEEMCVLVPFGALEPTGTVAGLARRGWTPTWGRAELAENGSVHVPSAVGASRQAGSGLTVVCPSGAHLSDLEKVKRLLVDGQAESEHRGRIVERLRLFADSLLWRSLDGPLPEVLAAMSPVVDRAGVGD